MKSDDSDKPKIVQFTKPKRDTPEDELITLTHECFEGMTATKWFIQAVGEDIIYMCANCCHPVPHSIMVAIIKENANG